MAAESRRQPWRSFRVRAVLVAVVVALAPLGFVAASSTHERSIGERMQARVAKAAEEAEALLRVEGRGAEAERRIDALARTYGVRLRVAGAGGRVHLEADHEATGFGLLSALFFGPDGAPSLRAWDETLGPLPRRREGRAAQLDAPQLGCERAAEGKLLVCHAARRLTLDDEELLVHAQESSRRDIRALHDVRYQIAKLTLFVLPMALLLAWWLGWRMFRPIESLRGQVLERVSRAAPGGALELARGDEIGDLARAFNALLARLEERERATEAFVADLAHELKNPVAAVRACAESLEGGAADEQRAARLARVLGDSSARLDAVVTQLLELARAEAGLVGEERERVDLGALTRALVEGSAADERWIGIDFTLERPTSGPVVRGVPHRLESAVANLVENAASYAGEGGRVRVSLREEGGEAVVEVGDSGPGIEPRHLPRVFERFFTTRGQRQGTGLGLALVKAVVEAHEGGISVASTPGEGASFCLRLPVA